MEKKEIRKERVYEERKGGNKWIKRETTQNKTIRLTKG